MKKIIFGLMMLITILVYNGCAQQQVQKETCKSPYIEYKLGECCLDTDSNNICDKDEGKKQIQTQSEIKEEAKPSTIVEETGKLPSESIKGKLLFDKSPTDLENYKPCYNFEFNKKATTSSEYADICFNKINDGTYLIPNNNGGIIKLEPYGGDMRKTKNCPSDKTLYTKQASIDSLQQYCVITHDNKYAVIQSEVYIYQPDGNNNFGEVSIIRPELAEETKEETQIQTTSYDLAYFPIPFIKDGKENGIIVVDDDMYNDEVIQESINRLSIRSINENTFVTLPIKLEQEVKTVMGENAIIIGTPCQNNLGLEFFEKGFNQLRPNECGSEFRVGEGRIVAQTTRGGNINILVGGGTDGDLIKAIEVLADYWNNADKLKGDDITIS